MVGEPCALHDAVGLEPGNLVHGIGALVHRDLVERIPVHGAREGCQQIGDPQRKQHDGKHDDRAGRQARGQAVNDLEGMMPAGGAATQRRRVTLPLICLGDETDGEAGHGVPASTPAHAIRDAHDDLAHREEEDRDDCREGEELPGGLRSVEDVARLEHVLAVGERDRREGGARHHAQHVAQPGQPAPERVDGDHLRKNA